ncbi:MAG TPA: DUF4184 family protein [Steroidobacteraceae bacterium]
MPFTFAHPAAVLPLRRLKSLRLAALMVGSVTPDLPYYVPAKYSRAMIESHTLMGALWLDIPLGLVTLLMGFLLRRPLTVLMSPRSRALCLHSMERFKEQPRQWLWAPLAIYIGTWTHIAWDAFTHDSGWVVRRVAALSAPITIGSYTGTLCHVLQYVSSAAGLLILAIWYLRLRAAASLDPPNTFLLNGSARVGILLLVLTIGTAIGGFISLRAAYDGATNYRVIYLLLTRSIAWSGLLYLGAGLLVLLIRRKPEPLAEI